MPYKNLKDCYGITEEDFAAILAAQGGRFAICGAKRKKKQLHLDHNHQTNEPRGFLCARHNVGLGSFHDSIKELRVAIKYPQKFSGRRQAGKVKRK